MIIGACFFQGWLGSCTFLHLISSTVTIPNLEALYKALSVLLFPATDATADGLVSHLYPRAQVTWVQDPMAYFFTRLRQKLRHPQAVMALDGAVCQVAGGRVSTASSPIA